MENYSASRTLLFGELLQATEVDPLNEMTERAGVIRNIEWRLCYDDDLNSIRDVPNNLTREEESKRLFEDLNKWFRESSTFSHLDPLAQAQVELPSRWEIMEWLSSEPANCNTAKMLSECVIREVPQLESANNITNRPIRPAKWKDQHKERKRCDFCLEFITLSDISQHMYNKHIYCNHCKKVHYSKSQQNLMYECPLFARFWNATYMMPAVRNVQ